MRFTVATYNIHKGFTQLNRRMVIHELRDRSARALRRHPVSAGGRRRPPRHAARHVDWPTEAAARIHRRHRSGTRSRTAGRRSSRHGHHGNAMLSRYPIVEQENLDISAHAFESRGLPPLRDRARSEARRRCTASMSTSGLFERGRHWQIQALCETIARRCRGCAARDRRRTSTTGATRRTGCSSRSSASYEVFEAVRGRPARTFPSVMPVFRLDRIYARGLSIRRRARPLRVPRGRHISDHAALAATFDTCTACRDEPVPAGEPHHAPA